MDKFTVLIVMMALQVYSYLQTYKVLQIKYLEFLVCQSYFNKSS